MITPFAVAGAKRLMVVCLEESLAKLTEIKNALPSWLARRIEIRVVSV
jgi:hypothetical protein